MTARDLQLIRTINALPDDVKDCMDFMLHRWGGDVRARILLDAMHSSMDKSLRYAIDRAIIDTYVDAVKRNDPRLDRRAHIDLAYVKKAWRTLLEDDDYAGEEKDSG